MSLTLSVPSENMTCNTRHHAVLPALDYDLINEKYVGLNNDIIAALFDWILDKKTALPTKPSWETSVAAEVISTIVTAAAQGEDPTTLLEPVRRPAQFLSRQAKVSRVRYGPT